MESGKPSRFRILAIAGNIGVGKTSLAQRLYHRWKMHHSVFLLPEEHLANPYLSLFFQDMHRWAFHNQITFLILRFRAWRRFIESSSSLPPGTIVLVDRSFAEDGEIFARTLYEMGVLAEREYQTYRTLFDTLRSLVPEPELIVYLRAPLELLVKRIYRRHRPYELRMTLDYLERLQHRYEQWIRHLQRHSPHRVLILPVDQLDFIHSEEDWHHVVHQIEKAFFPARQILKV